jgi:maleate cis-trans isomerase
MPNFRNSKGLPERMVSIEVELESKTGKPIVSSDTALYWRIFKTIGISPSGNHGKLLSTLVQNKTGNE